jgi:hypothetical protein
MNALMTRRETLSLLAALGVPASAVPDEGNEGGGLTSRVTFENARVRVLEYVSAGGSEACGPGRHFHPAHLTVYLTPARIRGHKDDGSTVTTERAAGEVAWFEAGWHASENVGPAGARLCMVEIKDKDWKPST